MIWNKKLSQRGDTIVEVLIVLAVLGLAFSISSATASRSLQQSRNAEEHSQSMGELNSQLEMFRKAIADGTTLPTTGAFCMTSPTTTAAAGTTACNTGSFDMKRQITYTQKNPIENSYYTLSVEWDGSGSLGTQKETFTYKVGGPAVGTLPWQINPAPTSTIRARVNKVVPISGQANCGMTATTPRAGTSVTIRNLTKPSAPQQTRVASGASALAEFLIEGAYYSDNYGITATTNDPNFTVCSISPSSQVSTAAPVVDVSVKILPRCFTVQDPSYVVNETRYDYTYSYAGESWQSWKYLQANPNPYSPAAPPSVYENYYSNGALYDRYILNSSANNTSTMYQDIQRARNYQDGYFDSNGRSRSDGRQSYVDRYYNRYMLDVDSGYRYYFTSRTSGGGYYFYDGTGDRFLQWTGGQWGYNLHERFPSFGEMRGSMNKLAWYRVYNNRIYYYNYQYVYTPPPRRQCAS